SVLLLSTTLTATTASSTPTATAAAWGSGGAGVRTVCFRLRAMGDLLFRLRCRLSRAWLLLTPAPLRPGRGSPFGRFRLAVWPTFRLLLPRLLLSGLWLSLPLAATTTTFALRTLCSLRPILGRSAVASCRRAGRLLARIRC